MICELLQTSRPCLLPLHYLACGPYSDYNLLSCFRVCLTLPKSCLHSVRLLFRSDENSDRIAAGEMAYAVLLSSCRSCEALDLERELARLESAAVFTCDEYVDLSATVWRRLSGY